MRTSARLVLALAFWLPAVALAQAPSRPASEPQEAERSTEAIRRLSAEPIQPSRPRETKRAMTRLRNRAAEAARKTAEPPPSWLPLVVRGTIVGSILVCGLIIALIQRQKPATRVIEEPTEAVEEPPPGFGEHPMVNWIAGRAQTRLTPTRGDDKVAPLPAGAPTISPGLWLTARSARAAASGPPALPPPPVSSQAESVQWLVSRPVTNARPAVDDPWDEALFTYGEHPMASWIAGRARSALEADRGPKAPPTPPPNAEEPSPALWLLSRPTAAAGSEPKGPERREETRPAVTDHTTANWIVGRVQAARTQPSSAEPHPPALPPETSAQALWLVSRGKNRKPPPEV
jgi:hypothetical protein